MKFPAQYSVKFHWLLPSLFTVFLLTSKAEATILKSWQFDETQNRLYITTDEGVQPTAQLIANPIRLVIDLPGTTVRNPGEVRLRRNGIEAVRVAQFDAQTTRLVIELSPGYTVDPESVKVRGATARQWTVELPTPQEIPRDVSFEGYPKETLEANAAETVIKNVILTPDGLFIRTSSAAPELKVQRLSSIVNIDFQGAKVSSELNGLNMAVNRNGIRNLQITQIESLPPVARITLNVSNSPDDWQATVLYDGNVIVLPTGVAAARKQAESQHQSSNAITEIQSVEMAKNGTQLVVKTDGPFTYTSGWDLATGYYKITIPAAKLGNRARSPQTDALDVRLQQADSETVAVWIKPESGIVLSEINQPASNILYVQLRRAPQVGGSSPVSNNSTSDFSFSNNGRIVVVVDPGHGGRDVGAVGINGIQEAQIVLDISLQVAKILEQNGVQVVMTRTDDREIDLEPRVQLAERVNASLFVSIHANAINMSRPDVNGIETYYYSRGWRLAYTIHNSILQATGARDRRVRQARFYVLRKTSMPAVLVETGFVTGAEDAPRLADPAYRRVMAEAIARGILQYIQQN